MFHQYEGYEIEEKKTQDGKKYVVKHGYYEETKCSSKEEAERTVDEIRFHKRCINGE